MKLLPPHFYSRDTTVVAQELLGKLLVRTFNGVTLAGYIVETESYTSADPACHAFRGKTVRTAPLFGPVGHTYVYFIYGNHFCLNIVARDPAMLAGGVLIRALDPVAGIEHMHTLRSNSFGYNLTNGPGKLTQALGITGQEGGISVTQEGALYVADGRTVSWDEIIPTPRIGIRLAQEKLWRFYIKSNPWISKK